MPEAVLAVSSTIAFRFDGFFDELRSTALGGREPDVGRGGCRDVGEGEREVNWGGGAPRFVGVR